MKIMKWTLLFLCIYQPAYATLITHADGTILHKESGLVIPSRAGDQILDRMDSENDTITYKVEDKEFSSTVMIAPEDKVPGDDGAKRFINAMAKVRLAMNPDMKLKMFDPPPYMDATKNAAAFLEGADNCILMYAVKLPHHVIYYSAGFFKSVPPEYVVPESRKVFQAIQWPESKS